MLPKETLLFILKHVDDPAAIVANQISAPGEEYGHFWDKNSDDCLRNLIILSKLPDDGTGSAIVLATECACEAIYGYARTKSNEDLQILDHFTLAIVCDEVDCGRKLEMDYDGLRPYEDVILGMDPYLGSSDFVNDLMKDMQGSRRSDRLSDAQQQELAHLLHEHDAKTVTERVWFPLNMRYLRAFRRKGVADFLIPRIAGHILPVELQDAIAAFCYDGKLFSEVREIVRKNATRIQVVEEMENI